MKINEFLSEAFDYHADASTKITKTGVKSHISDIMFFLEKVEEASDARQMASLIARAKMSLDELAKKVGAITVNEVADDVDDEIDEPVADADSDKIPNILMQLRKALDVDGNYPITFRDNSKKKLSLDQIGDFVKKYMKAKPDEKEMMQSRAVNSLEDFLAVLNAPEKPEYQHKIKGDRYMSHFRGDFDEK